MSNGVHARIAYLVGRLISGKTVSSLYDFDRSERIEVSDLPDAHSLREFNYFEWSYMAGTGKRSTKFRYSPEDGRFIDLAIKGNTFIGFSQESDSPFMGMMRGDSVYIFDQKAAAQFTYKIFGSPAEPDK